MNITNRLLTGFFSPFYGLELIFKNRKSLSYAVIPFLIGLLFVFLSFIAATQYFTPFVNQWINELSFLQSWPVFQGVFNFFILILSWILLSILNFIAGYICIMIIAGPFYALMVENLFKTLSPRGGEKSSWSLLIKQFFTALVKIVVFTLIGFICLIMAFFPGFGFFAAFIVAFMVAVDCMDYSFEVEYLSLKKKVKSVRHFFWELSGLTFAILLTGLLPGSFFILLPVFICGATKMYIQRKQ